MNEGRRIAIILRGIVVRLTFPRAAPCKNHAAHQSLDLATGDRKSFAHKLMPDLSHSVGLYVNIPDTLYLGAL